MGKEWFKDIAFRPKAVATIAHVNKIIANYQSQGLRLTLRQLYYQLVTVNAISNNEREYKRLSSVVSDGRLAGLIDWNAIEDRVRQAQMSSEFENMAMLVRAALYSYRLPRWDGQEEYVELWVEKDALAGVLSPIASKFHIPLMVNRGYSSQSAMYESAKRIIDAQDRLQTKLNERYADEKEGQAPDVEATIIYLGDFDPSGEDMVRDITDRLEMFNVENLTVDKVGLTTAQIKVHKPPPNPAKLTDPRAAAYIAQHGNSSWEVDALNPAILTKLITAEVASHVNQPVMDAVIKREEEDKKTLRKTATREHDALIEAAKNAAAVHNGDGDDEDINMKLDELLEAVQNYGD